MTKQNKTEYAFPQSKQIGDASITEGGMTLRDYFAAKAMQSLLLKYEQIGDSMPTLCKLAYLVADQMLAERERNND